MSVLLRPVGFCFLGLFGLFGLSDLRIFTKEPNEASAEALVSWTLSTRRWVMRILKVHIDLEISDGEQTEDVWPQV